MQDLSSRITLVIFGVNLGVLVNLQVLTIARFLMD